MEAGSNEQVEVAYILFVEVADILVEVVDILVEEVDRFVEGVGMFGNLNCTCLIFVNIIIEKLKFIEKIKYIYKFINGKS